MKFCSHLIHSIPSHLIALIHSTWSHSISPTRRQGDIKRAKKQLQRDRELDGIDTSNILGEEAAVGRGRPRRAAAAAATVSYRCGMPHMRVTRAFGVQVGE